MEGFCTKVGILLLMKDQNLARQNQNLGCITPFKAVDRQKSKNLAGWP